MPVLPAGRRQDALRSRPVTAAERTAAAAPERRRDFGGFLFWYVALQVFGASTFVLAVAAVSFVGVYLRLLDPRQWANWWIHAEPGIQGAATLLTLLLCIIVASAHHLGFWRGVGGWLAGNILGTIVMLPMMIATSAGSFYSLLVLSLLYVIGSVLAMIWKRRRMARALSKRGVLRVFE